MATVHFVGWSLPYAAFNVTVIIAYAMSLLGPVPFDLIHLFIGISAVGGVASLLIRISGVGLPAALFVSAVFWALFFFNYWLLLAAEAAV
ncbi:MAG TPA: hypothetical protein VHZ24_03835 [Pirellulales bacterium]|jgi:hypothetical protein|nr:hypothetical protein [Pirellulales bacterium]